MSPRVSSRDCMLRRGTCLRLTGLSFPALTLRLSDRFNCPATRRIVLSCWSQVRGRGCNSGIAKVRNHCLRITFGLHRRSTHTRASRPKCQPGSNRRWQVFGFRRAVNCVSFGWFTLIDSARPPGPARLSKTGRGAIGFPRKPWDSIWMT